MELLQFEDKVHKPLLFMLSELKIKISEHIWQLLWIIERWVVTQKYTVLYVMKIELI